MGSKTTVSDMDSSTRKKKGKQLMKYKETTFKEFYQCPVGVLRLKLAFKPEAGPRHG